MIENYISLSQAYHLMKLWRSAEGENATKPKMLEVLESLQSGRPRVPTQGIIDTLKRT